MNKLYENIKTLRINHDWTQAQLARLTGYERSMIAKIENGTVDLSQSKVAMFADIFNVSPAELMGMSDEPLKYNYVDTDALASAVTDDVSNQIMIEVHKMNAPEREELLNYIRFIMSKRNKEG